MRRDYQSGGNATTVLQHRARLRHDGRAAQDGACPDKPFFRIICRKSPASAPPGPDPGEISYYGALTGGLDASEQALKPRVFCVPNLSGRRAGFPDMGLFVAARGQPLDDWPDARRPERGVVVIDDILAAIGVKTGSDQVRRYLDAYGLVQVTNYRDFELLGLDARNQPVRRESFSFGCTDAEAFFQLA